MIKKEVSPQECKKILFGILVNIAKFCEMHNIKYSLSYGTLIGAIRHKGFIPWDDDIDIIMIRSEYDKFVSMYKDDHYKLIKGENIGNHMHVVVTDCDTQLEFLDSRASAIFYKGGLWVDVFPIDKVPEDQQDYCRLKRKIVFYNRLQRVAQNATKKKNRFYCVAYPFLRPFANYFGKKVSSLVHSNDNSSTLIVADLSLWYLNFPPFPASYMKEFVEVEFEGRKFLAMKEYDSFLRGIYGDYMQFPPLAERKPKHSYIAYWRYEGADNTL